MLYHNNLMFTLNDMHPNYKTINKIQKSCQDLIMATFFLKKNVNSNLKVDL